MYAVIFKAEFDDNVDETYVSTATRLRQLAEDKYGCTEFISSTMGNTEIDISYWPSLEHVRAWKNDPEHQQAQALGKAKWYKSYRVQVVEVQREYGTQS